MYVGLGVQMIGLFINSSVFVKDYSRKLASVHKLTESGRCMRTSCGRRLGTGLNCLAKHLSPRSVRIAVEEPFHASLKGLAFVCFHMTRNRAHERISGCCVFEVVFCGREDGDS